MTTDIAKKDGLRGTWLGNEQTKLACTKKAFNNLFLGNGLVDVVEQRKLETFFLSRQHFGRHLERLGFVVVGDTPGVSVNLGLGFVDCGTETRMNVCQSHHE
jgi:hypothetical protein